MYIRALQIDGFGPLAGLRLEGLSRGLTVIEGENEAGKSSLMAFIRAMLFGLERGQGERYEPMTGKAFGGVMKVCDAKGAVYTLERNFHSRDHLSIYLPDGQKEGKAYLSLLTGAVPSTVFRHVFAFGLDELERFESLQDEAIRERLYSTGLGLGNVSLGEVRRQLQGEMEKRFKPRGSTQRIVTAGKRYKELKKRLRELSSLPQQYNQWQRERREIAATIERWQEEREGLQREIARGKTILALKEVWDEWHRVKIRLDSLPPLTSFPPAGVERLRQLLAREEELRQAEWQWQAEENRWRQKWEQLPSPSPLLSLAEEYAALFAQREDIVTFLHELGMNQEQLRAVESSLADLYQRMADPEAEARVQQLDLSLPRREWVRQQEGRLAEAERSVQETEAHLARVREEAELVREEWEEKREALRREEATLPMTREQWEQKDHLLSLLEKFHEERKQLVRERDYRRQILHERRQWLAFMRPEKGKPHRRLVLLVLAAAGVAGLLLAVWLSSPWLYGLGGGAIVGAAVLWYTRNEREGEFISRESWEQLRRVIGQEEEMLTQQEERLASIEKEVMELSLRLAGKPLREQEVQALREEVNAVRKKWEQLQWKKGELNDISQKRKRLAQHQRQLEEQLLAERKEWVSRQQAWDEWLASQGLPSGLSTVNVLEIFHLCEQARQFLQQRDSLRARQAWLKEQVSVFREKLQLLLLNMSRPPVEEGKELQILDGLQQEWQKAKETEQKRAYLAEEKEKLIQQRHVWLKQWEELCKQKEKLFHAAGVQGEDEFFASAKVWEEKCELEQQCKLLEARLEAMAGTVGSWQELLADTSEERMLALQSDIKRWEEAVAAYGQKIATSQQRLGELKQQCEAMERSQEAADLLWQAQQQKAIIAKEAREWAVYALARALLEKAKEHYEREKQPAVMRRTTQFFRAITQEKYRAVWLPLGEQQAIRLENEQGHSMELARLSRGTAEQLYLAMRMALIGEMAAQGIILPIVMDDIFVNFDSGRFRATLPALRQLAETHQILFFTCHPHMAEPLAEGIPGTVHLHLKNGQLVSCT